MSGALGGPPSTGAGVNELLKLVEPQRDRLLIAALVALAAHAGLALFASTREPSLDLPPPPVDVEFTFREPPPPPPEPSVEPAAPEPPKAMEAPKPVLAKLAPPPPAAAAGAVLTAAPDAVEPDNAEPFDFTSDPNSTVYGSGVVAVGGTAQHGLAGARVGGEGVAPARQPAVGDGLTAIADLSERPRLRSADPCKGFFPNGATDDVATVSVRVVIGKTGKVSTANVVSESPLRQGFGAAARACMLDQTFSPALDRDGNPAATALAVNVRFSR